MKDPTRIGFDKVVSNNCNHLRWWHHMESIAEAQASGKPNFLNTSQAKRGLTKSKHFCMSKEVRKSFWQNSLSRHATAVWTPLCWTPPWNSAGEPRFHPGFGVSVGSYAGWIEIGRRAAAAMALHLISQPSFGRLTCRTPRKTPWANTPYQAND